MTELNAQLEALKMELGNNHGSTGNSLFGEVSSNIPSLLFTIMTLSPSLPPRLPSYQVDDRRLQVERKYVSLQVKYDSLEKRHTSMSQQYKRLKVRITPHV